MDVHKKSHLSCCACSAFFSHAVLVEDKFLNCLPSLVEGSSLSVGIASLVLFGEKS